MLPLMPSWANTAKGVANAVACNIIAADIFLTLVSINILFSPPFLDYLPGKRNPPETISTPKNVSIILIIAKELRTTSIPISPQ